MVSPMKHRMYAAAFIASLGVALTLAPDQSFGRSGPIGTHKFVYDIWRDAVNIASRMESQSLPNRIQISAATYQHLHGRVFGFNPHGSVDIKGKGPMETYFLLGRADEVIE